MEVIRVESNDSKWNELIEYAENCSWIAGKHLASMMRNHTFDEWEGIFAACYSPWIITIFVDEKYRGMRISERIINKTIEYAKEQNFLKVYIPSDMIGIYEKYGFQKIDELQNYGGDIDNIFVKEILY